MTARAGAADESALAGPPLEAGPPQRATWLDTARQATYEALWHGAMRFDRWLGSTRDETAYQAVFGSLALALLWDQHYGLTTPVRFNVYLPLPRLDERL
ncbi:MAG TPA: hypothetical protein VI653_11515, partial [Steroidobacteraceae bacterium]